MQNFLGISKPLIFIIIEGFLFANEIDTKFGIAHKNSLAHWGPGCIWCTRLLRCLHGSATWWTPESYAKLSLSLEMYSSSAARWLIHALRLLHIQLTISRTYYIYIQPEVWHAQGRQILNCRTKICILILLYYGLCRIITIIVFCNLHCSIPFVLLPVVLSKALSL